VLAVLLTVSGRLSIKKNEYWAWVLSTENRVRFGPYWVILLEEEKKRQLQVAQNKLFFGAVFWTGVAEKRPGKSSQSEFSVFQKKKKATWRLQRYRPRHYAHAGYDTDPATRMRTNLEFWNEKVNYNLNYEIFFFIASPQKNKWQYVFFLFCFLGKKVTQPKYRLFYPR
jgi:hypothetical protein